MAVLLVPMSALAAPSGTVGVSGDSTVIAVTVSPASWSNVDMVESGTDSTFVSETQGFFTATNTGNCAEDMTIKGTDAAGTEPDAASWTLGASPGSDAYTIGWGQATETTVPYDTESTYTSKLTTG